MTVERKMLIISSIIVIVSLFYIWSKRYYFRLLPIPIELIDLIDKGSLLLPSFQEAKPQGKVDFQIFDLKSNMGLRKTLNNIQMLSPFSSTSGLARPLKLTFKKWLKLIREKPMYCTDGTQLFMLAAWNQV